jgi:glyoxylase-like metal-dependent hydrolase (beta-lactamase superfamily II)
MSLDRRKLLQAAGAATAIAATLPLHRIASASPAAPVTAPAKTGQVPGIYRTRVGSLEVTSILDGGMELGLGLFSKASPNEAEKLQTKAFVKPGAVQAYVNAFVINTGTRLILVDSGGGSMMGQNLGRLQQNLFAAGFRPADFNEILLTHAHIDHVSGLVNSAGQPVFPQAQIRINDAELQYWYDDEIMGKVPKETRPLFNGARRALDPYKNASLIQTFKPGTDLGNGITPLDLSGHTPGHTGFRLADGADQLLIWGDIVHAPVLQFAHPDWAIAFDVDAAKAVETRKRILDEVTTDRIRVAGMHLSFPALGHVAKAGRKGYEFVPQAWEVF